MNTRARGFSLVEVLLAVTLLAAGIGLAFATLRNASQATARAEDIAQRNERLRAVQSFLRRQVDGALAMPYEYIEATGEATVFEADAETLRFVAPMPGYLSRGGPYVQEFRLVRGDRGLQLEFQHRLLGPEGPIEAEREPEVLLEGIAEGRFETRTLGQDGEPGPWTSDWETPGQLPRLVRLRLRMDDPQSHWPTLVASPRLGQSALPVAGGPVDTDGQEQCE